MIRVLCVTTKLCVGGVQTFLVSYAKELVKYDVWLDFAVQTKEPQFYDKELTKLGCRIFPIHSYNISRIRFFKDIYHILKGNPEYKIIHSHLNFINVLPLLAAYFAKCPVRISHSHSNYHPSGLIAKIARYMARFAINLIATDKWACSESSSVWLYGNLNNVKVIKNCVNYNTYSFNVSTREQIRKSLDLSDSLYVWIHVGSYSKVKNHKFILNVLKEYLYLDDNVRLILCGDGQLKHEIDSTINQLGLNDYVIQLGNRKNISDYLNAADVFVFPSLFEGLPFALIEAQTSGLPVIVSKAIPEEALFGNYFRCETYNALEWVQNIKNVIQYDRCLSLEQFRNSGYSLEVEAKKLSKLYMSLV